MSTHKGSRATLLLWAGIVLMLAGGALFLPRLLTYAETLLYTQRIPTAPPFDPAPPPVVANPEPTATATPEPTPAQQDVPSTPVEPTAMPTATPTEVWPGTAPVTLTVPAIDLVAPVVPIGWKIERISGQDQAIWDVPDWRAAGWHEGTAPLGLPGNTVLNGHNTANGEVFRNLYKVEVGEQLLLTGEDGEVYVYDVGEKYILREAGQPLSVRQENARYIQGTPDERITLVTCHPYGSLANRLVVIAYPVVESIMDLEGAN